MTLRDLYGADPNFTLGMDVTRYLAHGRGECSADQKCALCLLDEASEIEGDWMRWCEAAEAALARVMALAHGPHLYVRTDILRAALHDAPSRPESGPLAAERPDPFPTDPGDGS